MLDLSSLAGMNGQRRVNSDHRVKLMTATTNLEKRVRALEGELAKLKEHLATSLAAPLPWYRQIYGSFANDPAHKEAMRLGREYRESLRPGRKQAKTAKRSSSSSSRGGNGHSRHGSR
jgi:hypothetical protein